MNTQIPLGKLVLSTMNVRQTVDDGGTADLEASIMSHGLLSALVVQTIVAVPKSKQKFGVLAGGRRLRAFQALAARGEIAKDHLIDCLIRDEDAETSLELSVIENTARVNLTPVEEFAAFARLQAEDPLMDAAAIAKRFGTTELHVRQRMALGALHPTILDALGRGAITLDAAKAYAATADHALQLRVWEFQDKMSYGGHAAYTVRQLIKRGESAYDLAAMMTYVGRQAYVDAGGTLEVDLFAPEAPRVLHPGTLADLYYAKIEAEKAALAATLPANVAIVTEVDGEAWRRRVELVPKLDEAAEARRRAIDDRADAIAARLEEIASPADPDEVRFDNEDLNDLDLRADVEADQPIVDGLLAELTSLQNESEAILAKAPTALPDGPVIALMKLSAEGMTVTGYFRPADYADPDASPSSAPAAAQPTAKDQYGLTPDAMTVMAAHRRSILRAQMVDADTATHAAWASDYLIFAVLRATMSSPRYHSAASLGVGTISSFHTSADTLPVVTEQPGYRLFAQEIVEISEAAWMQETDTADALQMFLALDPVERRRLALIASAQMLSVSLAVPGREIAAHDMLATHLGVDDDSYVRNHWTPDAAYFALLPKKHRLAAVREVSVRIAKKMETLKDGPLSDACARFFAAGVDAQREFDMLPGQVSHARRWVPRYLSFNDDPPGPRMMETALDETAAATPRKDLDREALTQQLRDERHAAADKAKAA